jgi:hypothetical protein
MEYNDITSQSIRNLFFEFQSNLVSYERKFLKEFEINDVTPNEAKILHLVRTSENKSMNELADKLNHIWNFFDCCKQSCQERIYRTHKR